MLRLACLLSFLLSFAHFSFSQDNGCTERTVIVSASYSNGKTIASTLRSADIRGKINGKPVQILGVNKPTNVQRVVIVLDASSSMASQWQRMIEFAVEVVRKSSSSTEFALVIFADKELRTVGFGKTGPEMVDAIMSFNVVRPYGHTRLRDAIWKAVNLFAPNQEGDTIVVVSDGGDNESEVSRRQLREALWSRGVRIMFAEFSDIYLPTEEERMGVSDARDLSEGSGGYLSEIEKPAVILKVAQEIAFGIENYIAVRINLPAGLDKQASLHFEAVDSSGRKRKNIELRFPEKLLPCASLSSKQ